MPGKSEISNADDRVHLQVVTLGTRFLSSGGSAVLNPSSLVSPASEGKESREKDLSLFNPSDF